MRIPVRPPRSMNRLCSVDSVDRAPTSLPRPKPCGATTSRAVCRDSSSLQAPSRAAGGWAWLAEVGAPVSVRCLESLRVYIRHGSVYPNPFCLSRRPRSRERFPSSSHLVLTRPSAGCLAHPLVAPAVSGKRPWSGTQAAPGPGPGTHRAASLCAGIAQPPKPEPPQLSSYSHQIQPTTRGGSPGRTRLSAAAETLFKTSVAFTPRILGKVVTE